jgi:hypothetical protein
MSKERAAGCSRRTLLEKILQLGRILLHDRMPLVTSPTSNLFHRDSRGIAAMGRVLACIAFGVLSIALIADSGFSQDGKKEKDKDGKTMKGMLPPGFKDLNLSKEQISKIYSVQGEFKTKRKKLEEEGVKLKTEERTEIMKVLTEEQKQLFLKLSVGEEGGKKGSKEKTESK